MVIDSARNRCGRVTNFSLSLALALCFPHDMNMTRECVCKIEDEAEDENCPVRCVA